MLFYGAKLFQWYFTEVATFRCYRTNFPILHTNFTQVTDGADSLERQIVCMSSAYPVHLVFRSIKLLSR